MNAATLAQRALALPPRARAFACLTAAAALLCAVVAFAVTRDTRSALFATPLRADQLAEVEERLAAWNIPHAPSADNVRIDRRRRADVLLRLALAGVPHPHLAGSEEALPRLGALTPQSVLEAQTRDALAADLALGLRGLEGVADARIVIAPAGAGTYLDEGRRDATAAVRITRAAGAQLSARTIAGIQAFVAGGVPGLDAARVTVLDERGLALSGDGATDASDVQTALQSALDAAFGAGATIVRVHREPLGERRELHDVRRAALAGALNRSTTDERFASNLKRYSKSGASEDRGSETHDERRSLAADSTARLTVAIFVDAARRLDTAKIRALAAAAAGVRSDRGDLVRVEALAFGRAAPPSERGLTPSWLLAVLSALPQLAGAAAAVLIATVGARPLAQAVLRGFDTVAARGAARRVAGLPAGRVRGALVGEPPHVAAAIISALPAATAAAVLELYPPDERAAIVRRLARANAGLLPDVEELAGVRA